MSVDDAAEPDGCGRSLRAGRFLDGESTVVVELALGGLAVAGVVGPGCG